MIVLLPMYITPNLDRISHQVDSQAKNASEELSACTLEQTEIALLLRECTVNTVPSIPGHDIKQQMHLSCGGVPALKRYGTDVGEVQD